MLLGMLLVGCQTNQVKKNTVVPEKHDWTTTWKFELCDTCRTLLDIQAYEKNMGSIPVDFTCKEWLTLFAQRPVTDTKCWASIRFLSHDNIKWDKDTYLFFYRNRRDSTHPHEIVAYRYYIPQGKQDFYNIRVYHKLFFKDTSTFIQKNIPNIDNEGVFDLKDVIGYRDELIRQLKGEVPESKLIKKACYSSIFNDADFKYSEYFDCFHWGPYDFQQQFYNLRLSYNSYSVRENSKRYDALCDCDKYDQLNPTDLAIYFRFTNLDSYDKHK